MGVIKETQQHKLLAEIARIARQQRLLVKRINREELLADGIARDLLELERMVREGGSIELGGARRRHRSEARRTLRVAARAGVTAVKFVKQIGGSVLVRVDGGREFELPPALGALLSALAKDTGPSGDGLVAWKSMDEIEFLLVKKLGRKPSRHAIAQNVYRLREALFDRGGVNPHLVQTNRRLGLRFALRRPDPSPSLDLRWVEALEGSSEAS